MFPECVRSTHSDTQEWKYVRQVVYTYLPNELAATLNKPLVSPNILSPVVVTSGDVIGSSLGLRQFLKVLFSLLRQILGQLLELGHDHLLLHRSQLIIH
jgi:hypothetical protein